jgi:beta-glucanase (GH16 family)
LTVDFTKGIPHLFTSQGNPTTSSNGLALSVHSGLDAPTVVSTFYIMFGRVDVTMQTARGKGIVSSLVLQSDDLDEIDLEWLGGDNAQVQTNYFGKGKTDFYDRGAFSPNQGNQDSFMTYTIDWTANQITWQIAGNTIRTLTPETAHAGEYPQTPMQIKLGSWSGGDPANAPGTIGKSSTAFGSGRC